MDELLPKASSLHCISVADLFLPFINQLPGTLWVGSLIKGYRLVCKRSHKYLKYTTFTRLELRIVLIKQFLVTIHLQKGASKTSKTGEAVNWRGFFIVEK